MKLISDLVSVLLRRILVPALVLLVGAEVVAQPLEHIHVSGRHILGPCGDTLLLRGINYAPFNWGWSPSELRINEIEKTKANAVRLVWYKTGSGATPAETYADFVKLDTVLAQCVRHKLIPILVLHDQTCQNNPAALLSLATWFTQAPVLNLIQKYRHSLILNIANEALYVDWTGNPPAAQTQFFNTYKTIVQNLRNSLITVPLMIDGPECGTNLDVLATLGQSLQSQDPEHNLIFSAHAYWFAYAGNDSTQMAAKINNALGTGIPFVFGEVANLQDDVTNCQYSLTYKPLLRICQEKKLGWLAWSWDHDVCSQRQISSNGLFSSLSSYGQVIVNDPQTGIFTRAAPRSGYLTGTTCGLTRNKALVAQTPFQILREPEEGWFSIFPNKMVNKVEAFSLHGQQIEVKMDGPNRFFIPGSSPMVMVRLKAETGKVEVFKVFP